MKRLSKWAVPRFATVADPRLAISKHIGWTRPLTHITDFSTPEPDNYNYAVFNEIPYECPFLENQIFYKDKKQNGWWSVYHVPEEQKQEFLDWAEPLPFGICWMAQRYSKMRQTRTLLHARAHSVEQTTEERLFTMGYYELLQKEFEIDISDNLGQPRPNMPQGEFT
jgi:hypothetical protein